MISKEEYENAKKIVEEYDSQFKLIDVRKIDFAMKAKMIGQELSLQMVEEFIDYWTERSFNGKKMRFEKETVFDIKRRLKTWEANQKRFSTPEFKRACQMPNQYSKDYECKCTPEQMQAYWAHLRSLGLAPKKHADGSTLDWIPKHLLQLS